MRITYVGTNAGTSQHRVQALERLGNNVHVIDPFEYMAPWEWASRLVVKTGGFGAGLYAYTTIAREVARTKPDLIWVDHGAVLGPSLINSFRATGAPVLNYMIDNAWSSIYINKCRHYRAAIPVYDLIVQVREDGRKAAQEAGARHVYLASRSADEIAHKPREMTNPEKGRFASEVAFVGTWFPDRGEILADLARRGIPLSIWGDRWPKAPEWNTLAPYWRGPGLVNNDDYAAAIQSAKICIGLVSKLVSDDVTTRSFEIPALGGLFCAERTDAHLKLYTEGEEAVFWNTGEECAVICWQLLADEKRRASIARRGRERALKNGCFNEPELSKILAEISRICPQLAGKASSGATALPSSHL